DISSEENQHKVQEKINEAETKIQNMGLAVGNPADNAATVTGIVALVDELNILKEGVEEERQYETGTRPDDGVTYTERTEGGRTIYTVTETYRSYDYAAILSKAKQLSMTLEQCEAEYIIVPKIQLSYKNAVQDVLVGSNGDFKIELIGGSGGHVWTGTQMTTTGGYGAKVSAVFAFAAGQKLAVRTGGEGLGTARLDIVSRTDLSAAEKTTALHELFEHDSVKWAASKPGGWNGGGLGGMNGGNNDGRRWAWAPGSGGGGASDVRVYDGSGMLSSVFTYDDGDPRIIAAGGGGGAGQRSGGSGASQYYAMAGGNGGVGNGLGGLNGRDYPAYNPLMGQATTGVSPNKVPSWEGIGGKNGSTAGYDGEGRGGGGGGFQGGEAIDIRGYKGFTPTNGYLTGSGAGGSNHVKSTAKSKTESVHTQFGTGSAVVEWLQEPAQSAERFGLGVCAKRKLHLG
ncbi:MAG: hypothetical protein LBC72_00795, partial [Spirochaetaceae bacterium]|nr:hypothetical protein [Spirochaetaceae bacterium]